MEYIEYVVLGAGISGLAYAKNIKSRLKSNEQVVVFEETDHFGGLCHSFTLNGFTFDSAVHLSFTKNPEVRKVFDQTEYICHSPVSFNFCNGVWCKHPIVFNLCPFDIRKKLGYILSFLNRPKGIEVKNYDDWLRASYGDKLKTDFFDIYTEKYWTMQPANMGIKWIGERINCPNLWKLLKGSFFSKTGNDYYAAEMRYPANGGYKAFLKNTSESIDIRYKKKAVMVDPAQKVVQFDDGTKVQYGKLISSIPLNELAKMTVNIPQDTLAAAKNLKFSKISIVSVGFSKPDIYNKLWFYIYDRDILAARVNCPSVKSPNNVPNGCSSLQFEIYHAQGEEIDSEKIMENVRYALLKLGLAKDFDILFMDYRLLPKGNVIFYTGMEQDRQRIYDFYNQINVRLIGRFGLWDYLWSDQSFLSGMEAAMEDV